MKHSTMSTVRVDWRSTSSIHRWSQIAIFVEALQRGSGYCYSPLYRANPYPHCSFALHDKALLSGDIQSCHKGFSMGVRPDGRTCSQRLLTLFKLRTYAVMRGGAVSFFCHRISVVYFPLNHKRTFLCVQRSEYADSFFKQKQGSGARLTQGFVGKYYP